MPRINLDDENYAAEVLSYYLWGQKSAPSPSEITDNRWIDRTGVVTLDVDPNQFLTKNGDLFNAKDFELAKVFFSGEDVAGNSSLDLSLITSTITPNANGGYELTHGQFVELFYGVYNGSTNKEQGIYDGANNPVTSISLYRRSLGVFDGDYGKRSFVFGTVAVTLDTQNVRYTLDKSLNPMYIKNFDLIINDKDFDFQGGKGSAFANEVLKKVADPSGIGKQVILDFGGGAKKSIPILAKHSFNALEDLDGIRDFSKFALEWNNIVNTGVVDYQDENGKLVVFGSNGNDSLQDAKVKLADLANGLDAASLTIVGKSIIAYKLLADRGITYVAGEGSDTVYAGDGNDTIYTNANILSRYDRKTSATVNKVYAGEGDDKIYESQLEDIKMKLPNLRGYGFVTATNNIFYKNHKEIAQGLSNE